MNVTIKAKTECTGFRAEITKTEDERATAENK